MYTYVHSIHLYNSFLRRYNEQSIIYNPLVRFKRICANDKISLSHASKLFIYILATQFLFSGIILHFTYLNGLTEIHCFLTPQNSTTDLFA